MTHSHCESLTSVPALVILSSLQPWRRGTYQATSELQLGMGRKPLPWLHCRTAVRMRTCSAFPAAGSIALLACTRSCAQTSIPVAFATSPTSCTACMHAARRYRRQKELDEARKAGLAPAALDEDGKEINPHIPEYMTSAPWYLNKDKPTLQHQRNWKEKQSDNEWYDRGAKVFQATKYRKGACEK